MPTDLIITGASGSYAPQLLALVGSANANWPGHPPILVYDLGLPEETLDVLKRGGVDVRRIPEFCPHWRKHFAWKIWCLQDAPADRYVWLDAGIYVQRPFPEAFAAMESLGYFVQPNGFSIEQTACRSVREYFAGHQFSEVLSINGGLHGFDKRRASALLAEAYSMALDENYLAADTPAGRHDQDLLSFLMYKHFAPVVFLDRHLYAEHAGPSQVLGQRVWIHRREMHPDDADYFRECVTRIASPRLPSRAPPARRSWVRDLRIQIAKWRGRYPDETQVIYTGVRD